MLHHDSDRSVPPKGQDACEEFVQYDPESIDIALLIGRIASNLFRREIERARRASSVPKQFRKNKIGNQRFTDLTRCIDPTVE